MLTLNYMDDTNAPTQTFISGVDNIIGNEYVDEYTTKEKDGSQISYVRGYIINHGCYAARPLQKALEEATLTFNEWRIKILKRHGYLKPMEDGNANNNENAAPDANEAGAVGT